MLNTIITLEVSRLSRSTQQLCEIVNIIKKKHLRLIILGSITIDCRNGDIDPMSQAFVQMSAVFAELELSMIRARVRSGMQNAKAKGKKIGRQKTTKEDIPAIFYRHFPAYASKELNISEFAKLCNLSRPTIYKYLELLCKTKAYTTNALIPIDEGVVDYTGLHHRTCSFRRIAEHA